MSVVSTDKGSLQAKGTAGDTAAPPAYSPGTFFVSNNGEDDGNGGKDSWLPEKTHPQAPQ